MFGFLFKKQKHKNLPELLSKNHLHSLIIYKSSSCYTSSPTFDVVSKYLLNEQRCGLFLSDKAQNCPGVLTEVRTWNNGKIMSFGDGSSGSRSQLYYLIALGSGQSLKFSELHLSHVSQENTTRITGSVLNEGLYLTVLSVEPARGKVPELTLQGTDQLQSPFASSLRVSGPLSHTAYP